MLHAEPAPEPVTFDTLVDLVTKNVTDPRAGDVAGAMSDALLPTTIANSKRSRGWRRSSPNAIPKIAGRLRLSADTVDDPHVARLLEGVAFLAARVHHRLDDEFPELTDACSGCSIRTTWRRCRRA